MGPNREIMQISFTKPPKTRLHYCDFKPRNLVNFVIVSNFSKFVLVFQSLGNINLYHYLTQITTEESCGQDLGI
ncbi:unnamed protein product [Bursaphelenchus okinawaensis]|uniref:Uncharacterized protein n=1 Tax=Bursaphelenchus okinawaensis TaxID=465554 RepID=A0A811JUL6_9BILA|nr:unnamed protein product [Bursaphelenchus okinawaensis]CAG9083698.1 unnamed protein product [Bursaphelenchus okinawaensis]